MLNSAFPPAARRVSRQLCVVLATLVAALVVVPGVAGAADFHATPSTFASMFSQAQGGDTVYLASGQLRLVERGREESGMVVVAADSWGVADDVGRQLRIERAQHHDPGGDVHRAGRGRARLHAVEPGLRR